MLEKNKSMDEKIAIEKGVGLYLIFLAGIDSIVKAM